MHLEAWITSIGVSRVLAKHLPQAPACSTEDPFFELRKMTDSQIEVACASALADIINLMKQSVCSLRAKPAGQAGDDSAGHVCLHSKYEMCGDDAAGDDDVVASFGRLEEFYKGLDYHLGLPNPNVLKAMADEHTVRADSQLEFTTPNYGSTTTTPALEWEFVTNPRRGKQYPGRLREPQPLSKFLEHPMAKKADLTEAEITAMRLYTGPMYQK
jgi:hypothetical protein